MSQDHFGMLSVGLWFEEDAHLLHVEIKAAAGFSSDHQLYVKAQLLPDPNNDVVRRTKLASSKTPVWNEGLTFPVWYHELFYKKLILILKEKRAIGKNLTRGMLMLSSLGEAAKSHSQCICANHELKQIVFWGSKDEEVLHLGFLQRKDRSKKWNKHLCVLTPKKFSYYKHKRDSIPAGALDLCEARVSTDNNDNTPTKSNWSSTNRDNAKHGFSITVAGPVPEAARTFHFDAETEDDRKMWVSLIDRSISSINRSALSDKNSTVANLINTPSARLSAELQSQDSGVIPVQFIKVQKADEIMYSGWLKKVSGVLKSRRKRWFVLSQSFLSYWKKQPLDESGVKETESISQIPLYHARLAPQPLIDKWAFSLHPMDHPRSYTLICKDGNDMNIWVKYIQDAIDSLSSLANQESSVDTTAMSKLLSSFSEGTEEHSLGNQKKEDMSGRLVSYLPHLCVKRLVHRDLMRGSAAALDPALWHQQLTEMLPSQTDAETVTLADAAVAVMDISGFTRLNEILAAQGKGAAEQVSQHINTYFGQLLDIVFQHGGDCIKFAGDALLVVFSDAVPVPPAHCITPRITPRFILPSSPPITLPNSPMPTTRNAFMPNPLLHEIVSPASINHHDIPSPTHSPTAHQHNNSAVSRQPDDFTFPLSPFMRSSASCANFMARTSSSSAASSVSSASNLQTAGSPSTNGFNLMEPLSLVHANNNLYSTTNNNNGVLEHHIQPRPSSTPENSSRSSSGGSHNTNNNSIEDLGAFSVSPNNSPPSSPHRLVLTAASVPRLQSVPGPRTKKTTSILITANNSNNNTPRGSGSSSVSSNSSTGGGGGTAGEKHPALNRAATTTDLTSTPTSTKAKRPSSTRRSLNLGQTSVVHQPRLSVGSIHPNLLQQKPASARGHRDSLPGEARARSRSRARNSSNQSVSFQPIMSPEDDVTNDEEDDFSEDFSDEEEDEGDEGTEDEFSVNNINTQRRFTVEPESINRTRKISDSMVSSSTSRNNSLEAGDLKAYPLLLPSLPSTDENSTSLKTAAPSIFIPSTPYGSSRRAMHRRREREAGHEHINTLRAVQCMLEVQEKCGKYLADSVCLTLHIGISCGDVYGLHVGGEQNEWEFLIAGCPFRDLGSAVDAGQAGDVICSARAWALIKDKCTGTVVSTEEPHITNMVCAASKVDETVYAVDKHGRILSKGTIVFKGEVDFSPAVHIGIELVQPAGNCDGSRNGERYFQCGPNYGLFWLDSALSILAEVPVAKGGGEVKVTKVNQAIPKIPLPNFPVGYSPTELAMHPLISSAMRCYIPRMIHDEGRELLAAENRKASVIFVNLRLGLDQEVSDSRLTRVASRVHSVLRTMQQIIFNNDGYRRQFLVDDKGCVLIVVFGVPPFAHEKDCYRAVKCALELRQALAEAKVSHSIGIATGLVYSGAVGFARRREHAVVGDTVNLAARLCGKAKPWEILTDQTTADTVDSLIRMETRGEIQVKGKQLKQAIFAPLALSKQDGIGEQRGETTGRSFELMTFRSHLATVSKGQGATLFLTGLPGMGKTQLCRTFYGLASGMEHLEVLYVAGDGTEMSTPFSLWSKLLEQMMHLPEHKGTAERDARRRQKVIDFLKAKNVSVPNALHLLDILFPNIRLGKVTNVDDDITSEKLCKQMNSFIIMILQQAFQSIKQAGASKQVFSTSGLTKKKGSSKVVAGAVWLLDDAHAIDELSWVVLRKVIDMIISKQLPIFLVLSARPPKGIKQDPRKQASCNGMLRGWANNFTELSERKEISSIALNNLNLTDLKRIVTHRLGCRGIPSEIMEFLMRMSLGNPLYAIELGNHLVSEKHLRVRLDREMVCTTPLHKLATMELPTSLQSLLVQQIDSLPVSIGYVCKLASIFGMKPMLIPVLAAMMREEGLDESELVTSLQSLHDARMLDRCADPLASRDPVFRRTSSGGPQDSYQFISPMMAHICYSLLLFKQRIKLHLSAADNIYLLLRKDKVLTVDEETAVDQSIVDHRFRAVQNFVQGGGSIPNSDAPDAAEKRSTFPPGLADAIAFLLKTPGYSLDMLQKGTNLEVGVPLGPELAQDVRIRLDLLRQEWTAACEHAGLSQDQEAKLLSRLLLLHPAQQLPAQEAVSPSFNARLTRDNMRQYATKSLLQDVGTAKK